MQDTALKPGISFSQELTVEYKDTAAAYGSGRLKVFATPAMVGLMENTAMKSLDGVLDDHYDTVGIAINVTHTKATPMGKKVSCKATVTQVEGRKVTFEIEAWDESGSIGKAIHERFIIDPVKFMQKLNS